MEALEHTVQILISIVIERTCTLNSDKSGVSNLHFCKCAFGQFLNTLESHNLCI